MKAIILAAGRGQRLKDKTESLNKCMLKFQDKHLIEYSLESARKSKVEEIIIVVNYRAEDIINKFGINYKSTRIQYVFQKKPKGVVDAISRCEEALSGADFVLLFGDEILVDTRLKEMVDLFHKDRPFAICGGVQVANQDLIRKTYTILYDEQSKNIHRLIEKPRKPLNDVMGTGNCAFNNKIFDYISQTPVNTVRGVKDFPDLIQCAVDDGNIVKLFFISSQYVNVNTLEDVQLAQQTLMGTKEPPASDKK